MPCARALHGFEGQGTHELSFSAGVSILLLRRIDENWLEGKLDGKVGIFPANYVKIQLGSPSGKVDLYTLLMGCDQQMAGAKNTYLVNL